MAREPGTRKQRNRAKPAKTQSPAIKHRPTAGEKIKRVDMIEGFILSGTRRAEILEFTRVHWGLAEAQTDNYIAEATALIKAEANKTREESFAEHIEFRRQIRKRAMGEGDLRVALESARDEAKLRGLYPSEKHELTGKDGMPIQVQDMEALRQKRFEKAMQAIVMANSQSDEPKAAERGNA
jgi:hypothetical protein